MPKFMALAYDQAVRPQISPEQAQQVTQKYIDWTMNLHKKAQVVSASKLTTNEGRVLRAQGAEVIVTDGPHLESKEVLGGYWMFEAANYDEALKLVSDHPHLLFGGTLELREVDHM